MTTSDPATGIMSWRATANADKYAIKFRPAGTMDVTYKSVSPNLDDTSDGTMDIPLAWYVQTSGSYLWRYKTQVDGSWDSYSSWQPIELGTSTTAPDSSAPQPTGAQPSGSQPSGSQNPGAGIMSWQAVSNADKYAIKFRPEGSKDATYKSIATNLDDTSDGTMDIPISWYVEETGSYLWRHKAQVDGTWGSYSEWLPVTYGGSDTDPGTPGPVDPAPGPAPADPPPSGDGIMSWQAVPNADKYAIKFRLEGSKDATYKTVATNLDDTSDGTMDIPISWYVEESGSYLWRYKTQIDGSWDSYSEWLPVEYAGGPSGDGTPSIMVIGDSFTIPSRGFPSALDQSLTNLGYDIDVIAFSRSGDTAAQALARLQGYLNDQSNPLPDMALVALGTNDAVQELATATTKAKLDSIIDLFAARDIEVLLTQPDAHYPNRVSGAKGFDTPAEQNAFLELFEELAAENDVVFARDFHDGLDNPAYLEADGFHPNQAGTQLMAQNITAELDALVQGHLADVPVS